MKKSQSFQRWETRHDIKEINRNYHFLLKEISHRIYEKTRKIKNSNENRQHASIGKRTKMPIIKEQQNAEAKK